jgi:hypothetical protein
MHSKDPREIKIAAVALASGASHEAHEQLAAELTKAEFLNRLDPPEEKASTYVSLRVTRVLDVLSQNQQASAREALVKLIDAKPWNDNPIRMILLIRELAAIRPTPPSVIAYWDRWSQPGSSLTFDVVEAACMNQSAPAMEVFRRKLTEPKNELSDKKAWLRQIVLPRRNDEPLLKALNQVLTGEQSHDLQVAIVEALFDYNPDAWYRGDDPPTPPDRAQLTHESRELLISIGEYSLHKIKMEAKLKSKVENVVEALRQAAQ